MKWASIENTPKCDQFSVVMQLSPEAYAHGVVDDGKTFVACPMSRIKAMALAHQRKNRFRTARACRKRAPLLAEYTICLIMVFDMFLSFSIVYCYCVTIAVRLYCSEWAVSNQR